MLSLRPGRRAEAGGAASGSGVEGVIIPPSANNRSSLTTTAVLHQRKPGRGFLCRRTTLFPIVVLGLWIAGQAALRYRRTPGGYGSGSHHASPLEEQEQLQAGGMRGGSSTTNRASEGASGDTLPREQQLHHHQLPDREAAAVGGGRRGGGATASRDGQGKQKRVRGSEGTSEKQHHEGEHEKQQEEEQEQQQQQQHGGIGGTRGGEGGGAARPRAASLPGVSSSSSSSKMRSRLQPPPAAAAHHHHSHESTLHQEPLSAGGGGGILDEEGIGEAGLEHGRQQQHAGAAGGGVEGGEQPPQQQQKGQKEKQPPKQQQQQQPLQKVPVLTAAPARFGDPLVGTSPPGANAKHQQQEPGAAGSQGEGPRKREYGSRKRPLQDLSGRITLLYSSYLGGAGDDVVAAAAASKGRGIWIAGHTSSDLLDGSRSARRAPGTQAHRRRVAAGSGQDAFVAQIAPGGEVLHVTYIGGSGKETLCGITDEGPDGVWAVGSTTSADLEPPASPGAAQQRHSGAADAMLVNIRPGGEVRYLSYLGGTGVDTACAVARGPRGHVWVGGTTQSRDLPTTEGADEPRRGGGGSDGFLGNFGPEGRLRYLSYVSGQVGSDGVTALLTSAEARSSSTQQPPLRQSWLGGFVTVPSPSSSSSAAAGIASGGGGMEIDALVAPFGETGEAVRPPSGAS